MSTWIWPCYKVYQGQPRIIIWTNLLEPESLMLHIKFQGHWPFGIWDEDFQRFFFPYMGIAAILVMWPRHYEQTFVPPPNGVSACNLVSIGPAVWKCSSQRLTTAYPISSPGAFRSAEVTIQNIGGLGCEGLKQYYWGWWMGN